LPSPTFSLLTGQWLDFHHLADYHASRTTLRFLYSFGKITQNSGDLMRFLLQITGIHPDFEIKLKKPAGLLLGELNFN